MTGFLARHGTALDEVAAWAIHPGGPRILDSALRALHLPTEAGNASRAVLRAKGNMSSPTVLFILKQQLELGTRGLIAAAAFGPGLTAEMGLFRAN
jgi:predicted naringenin-chalcone synthase